ncbi:hypothetical protein JTE90_001688, partial [Oedothorax gibbosus]
MYVMIQHILESMPLLAHDKKTRSLRAAFLLPHKTADYQSRHRPFAVAGADNMSSQVVRPILPYNGSIPGGLHEGKLIEVKGTVPYGADWFSINLLTGFDSIMSDRPLHISVRFDGRVAVRNHQEMNEWGPEERSGPFPFQMGHEFKLMILVENTSYRIAVNSQHCWEFVHRIPIERVSNIYIEGSVEIERIEFVDKLNPYVPRTCSLPPSTNYPVVRPYPGFKFPYQPGICGMLPDQPDYKVFITPGIPTNPSYPGTCYIPPTDPGYPQPGYIQPEVSNLAPVFNPILQGVWRQENIPYKDITQVLGVKWDTDSDVFQIDVLAKIVEASREPVTKRILLKLMSKFYDPLGLFAPVAVVVKILFQDTWLSGIHWDELLPPAVAQQWHKWLNELQCLNDIRIPRWIGFSENSDTTIHVFCDASERAYGACLYSRQTVDSSTSVSLICSRNKLAPVKKVTLPRLELLAALLGARLLQYLCKETNMNSYTAILWSDSTVALSWIKGDPNRWKTFVCNRTTEILQHTTPAQWRHCPGTDNPADHLTRGTFPSQLLSLESWWQGPKWLTDVPENWPIKDLSYHPLVEVETRKTESQSFYVATTEPIIDMSRYSSYTKLLRVTAWILRFVHNCKSQQRVSSDLTSDEFERAKTYWIRTVQQQCFAAEIEAAKNAKPLPAKSKISRFNPFLKDNILRLGGRLQFANISTETKHPILLDGSHPFVKLLIRYTHVRLHHMGVRIVLSELRSNFWILRGRQAIKNALHNCLPCKIARAKCDKQVEAPLPADRLTPCKPFDTTGIDFAGPVYVRGANVPKKSYIALFTCSTTRALHIELVSDLTTDTFLMALQRFVGRRGLPHTIYTDNATTFQAANKELIALWNSLSSTNAQQFYAGNGIRWKFIVPRAAWWGGWWE